ncbi:MAG: barstar family protein [Burkholderiaceae bacterium]
MSVLSNLPPQAVLPLSAYKLSELRESAANFQQTFLYVSCAACTDKLSILKQIASSFHFGDYFGENLDALYDCVTDMEPDRRADKPGFVIVLEGLPQTAEFDAVERNRVLDVFRDAADFFDDNQVAFRVFYSVNKAAAAA